MRIARHLNLVGMVTCAAMSIYAQTYNISTVAGATASGSKDGVGNAARFNQPECVVADNAGNIYVADTYNRTIRKISPNGVVTTIAGQAGNSGTTDGIGSASRFFGPVGIALDSMGNLFVADAGSHTIRKVTPTAEVTTYVGLAGVSGSADGVGNDARFYGPAGVATDKSGNLFVADSANYTIRKVTTDRVVTTLAGSVGHPGSADGPGDAARFDYVSRIAVDGNENIYVADTWNHTIRKITKDGVVSTFAGNAQDPGSRDGSNARFGYPVGVCVDGLGNVYVTENTISSTIRKITSDGFVTTLAGTAGIGYRDGPASVAMFNQSKGLSFNDQQTLYLADTQNNMIRKGTPILPLQIYSAGSRLAVAWPSWASNFVLENQPATGNTNVWTAITNGIASDTNNFIYAFPPTNSAQFFRVRSP